MLKPANPLLHSSDSDIDYEPYDSSGYNGQSRTSEKIPEQRLSTFVPSGTNILSSSKEEWTIRLTDGDVLDLSLRIIDTVLTPGDRPWYLWVSMRSGFIEALSPSWARCCAQAQSSTGSLRLQPMPYPL